MDACSCGRSGCVSSSVLVGYADSAARRFLEVCGIAYVLLPTTAAFRPPPPLGYGVVIAKERLPCGGGVAIVPEWMRSVKQLLFDGWWMEHPSNPDLMVALVLVRAPGKKTADTGYNVPAPVEGPFVLYHKGGSFEATLAEASALRVG